QVLRDPLINLRLGLVDRLQQFAQLIGEPRLLVLQSGVGLFQLRKVVLLRRAVGMSDLELLVLVAVEFALLLLFAAGAAVGLNLVGERVDVGALVGEDLLHGEDIGVYARQIFFDLFAARLGRGARPLVSRVQALVLTGTLQFFLRGRRLRLHLPQVFQIAALELRLESLPRPLAVRFVPQRPEECSQQQHRRDHVVQRVRFAGYRVLLGDGLLGHRQSPVVSRPSIADRRTKSVPTSEPWTFQLSWFHFQAQLTRFWPRPAAVD